MVDLENAGESGRNSKNALAPQFWDMLEQKAINILLLDCIRRGVLSSYMKMQFHTWIFCIVVHKSWIFSLRFKVLKNETLLSTNIHVLLF